MSDIFFDHLLCTFYIDIEHFSYFCCCFDKISLQEGCDREKVYFASWPIGYYKPQQQGMEANRYLVPMVKMQKAT